MQIGTRWCHDQPIKRLLGEPLLHFVVAGALLFGIAAWLDPSSPESDTGTRQVRIGEGEVRWLAETWSRQWGREPAPDELCGLVTELLKEEVLAREARAMGLDEGDTIVRRRLAQKVEFLVRDTARLAEPTEEDLRRFYESNRAAFQAAVRVSFKQVYFSPQRRGDAARDARTARYALARSSGSRPVNAAALGDPSVLATTFDDADPQTVASMFGANFSAAVLLLEPGSWQGPIESAYGLHLVQVTRQAAPQPQTFEEAKTRVADLWRSREMRETESKFFRRLLEKYDVRIDESVKSLIGPLPVAQLDGEAR